MPPVNDNFADATVLSGATGSVTGDNTGATWESAEPSRSWGFGTTTVWFTWTAPADGDVQFSVTTAAGIYVVLEIFIGSTLTSLTFVDVTDNFGGAATLTVAATSGTTYSMRVFGYNDDYYGALHLTWGPPTPPPPPPPAFVEVWAWLETG